MWRAVSVTERARVVGQALPGARDLGLGLGTTDPGRAFDPRQEHLRDIHHLPEFDRLEIQHFFEVYKDLEPGKSVEGSNWTGRAEAEAEIEASRRRLADSGH